MNIVRDFYFLLFLSIFLSLYFSLFRLRFCQFIRFDSLHVVKEFIFFDDLRNVQNDFKRFFLHSTKKIIEFFQLNIFLNLRQYHNYECFLLFLRKQWIINKFHSKRLHDLSMVTQCKQCNETVTPFSICIAIKHFNLPKKKKNK